MIVVMRYSPSYHHQSLMYFPLLSLILYELRMMFSIPFLSLNVKPALYCSPLQNPCRSSQLSQQRYRVCLHITLEMLDSSYEVSASCYDLLSCSLRCQSRHELLNFVRIPHRVQNMAQVLNDAAQHSSLHGYPVIFLLKVILCGCVLMKNRQISLVRLLRVCFHFSRQPFILST